MTESLTKKSKLHTRRKQETNVKESKKKTRNMKYETRINARNKSWKEIKTKEKKKELKSLPPSSLMLACSLHNLNESKYYIYCGERN